MKHWNKLQRDMVNAPSLKTFKYRLDRALSSPFQLEIPIFTTCDTN